MNTIGERLEAERKRRDLSQKEFAALFELSQSTYNEYKAGKKKLPAEVFMRMSTRLCWAPEYLFYGTGVKMSDARTHHEAQLLELLRSLPPEQHDTIIGMVRVAVDGLHKANSGAA